MCGHALPLPQRARSVVLATTRAQVGSVLRDLNEPVERADSYFPAHESYVDFDQFSTSLGRCAREKSAQDAGRFRIAVHVCGHLPMGSWNPVGCSD